MQTNHDVACVNGPVALLPHVADTVARAGLTPFRAAALDTIGTDRLYMPKLSRHDLFRIHAQDWRRAGAQGGPRPLRDAAENVFWR